MKKNHHHHSATAIDIDASKLVPIRIEYSHPTARSVSVAGCFNHWNPQARALIRDGGGHWHQELSLPPGTYQYRLVVDGEWIPDPAARESVPNPFGGWNSVLKVPTSAQVAQLDTAQNQPPRSSPN
jgi:1,4-alpha-glucan branching enzyme